jgi:hypothetical protein
MHRPIVDHGGRSVDHQLLAGIPQDRGRGPSILAQESVRCLSESIPGLTGIYHEDASPSARQLKRGGEAGESSANDDRIVVHVRVHNRLNGNHWKLTRPVSPELSWQGFGIRSESATQSAFI